MINVKKENTLGQVKSSIENELQLVEKNLNDIDTDVIIVKEIASHILSLGGKRIRPTLMILAAKFCGYSGSTHIDLAVILEMIHAATLLHDDVIDNSNKRRKLKTANAIWDNKHSILAGDYIYSQVFQKITKIQNLCVLDILSSATSIIVEGEIMQLSCNNIDIYSINRYLEIISRKTAKLFAVAGHLAAVISDSNDKVTDNMINFANNFGMAYQIINDIHDYRCNSEVTGKNFGDDLKEGKITLPLLLAYKNSKVIEKTFIEEYLNNKHNSINEIYNIVNKTKSLELSLRYAENFANQAKECINTSASNLPNAKKEHLISLIDYLMHTTIS